MDFPADFFYLDLQKPWESKDFVIIHVRVVLSTLDFSQ